jgi:DNA processing protein
VGNETARRLLAAWGLPQNLFAQSHAALAPLIGPALARALLTEPEGLSEQIDTTRRWLDTPGAAGVGRALVTLGDPAYPAALLTLEDPPLMLYLLGRTASTAATPPLAAAAARGIAMVGSRNPTPQGAANARQFARALAGTGLTVVSGLALGVDGAAHEGALEGAAAGDTSALATVAVVGTGLDRVYPSQHRDLAHRIAERGLLVSEYPLGTPPLRANFPRRNRLIAGLSLGTLVVEAALKSGSLITARLAGEQGKEVFAIPGSIHASQSRGCHALIRQGAKLVESAQDVLEELRLPALPGVPKTSDSIANNDLLTLENDQKGSENPLLTALGHDPAGLDALQARTGLDTARLQAALLELELDGQVARLPGGLFQRLVTV